MDLIPGAKHPETWLRTRVAGDALDTLLLSAAIRPGSPDQERAMLAILADTPIVAFDVIYARRSQARQRGAPGDVTLRLQGRHACAGLAHGRKWAYLPTRVRAVLRAAVIRPGGA